MFSLMKLIDKPTYYMWVYNVGTYCKSSVYNTFSRCPLSPF